LDGLVLITKISIPTYPKHLIRALAKYPNITKEDWIKIIDLGKWISRQSEEISNEDFSNYNFDGDKHWGWCKQEFIKIIAENCKSKEQNQIPENLSSEVVSILKKIILDKDAILENWKIDNDRYDRYYTRAINSCHGEALATLIEFALLEFRKDNKNYASEILTPVLDKLISQNYYLEGFAVLGRYLPWINLINHKWVRDNLEAILPINNNERFNAVWLTYINFVPSFDDVFDLLKEKYLFAIENPIKKGEDNQQSNFKLGEKIAVFYSRGKIKLEDDLLKKFFKNCPRDGSTMISLIGREIGFDTPPAV
jgi:flagellar biosynthesis regulator FlaF